MNFGFGFVKHYPVSGLLLKILKLRRVQTKFGNIKMEIKKERFSLSKNLKLKICLAIVALTFQETRRFQFDPNQSFEFSFYY
jgi:hypothetical protein